MNAFARAARHKAMLRLHEHQIEFSPDRTLVIIDMQKNFLGGCEMEIVPNVIALVKHAMAKGWAIIVVEYVGSGATDKEITEALGEYPHQETVVKDGCDGSREILECIASEPAWSLNLLVCGVYGPDCVAATVSGLFDNSSLVEVDVVTDAISPSYKSYDYGKLREREVTLQGIGAIV
jgi:nicotinamidase-related amidase